MKSLNTSLPRSSRRRSDPPPEQLIQTFKAAALSVTNLYKTAASDLARAREAGYQDALDDILALLDKENLGLDDGEGWRVRQWATERLDGSPLSHSHSDNDEDRGEARNDAQRNSSDNQRTEAEDKAQPREPSQTTSPIQDDSVPTVPVTSSEQRNDVFHTPEIFSFRSAQSYPQDIDMQTPGGSNVMAPQSEPQPQTQVSPPSSAVRVEVVPRASRTPHRGSRHNTRAVGGTRSLGTGAGSKRGFRFGDYEFDLGLGEGKEGASGGGGGKRGRFT